VFFKNKSINKQVKLIKYNYLVKHECVFFLLSILSISRYFAGLCQQIILDITYIANCQIVFFI